MMKEGLGHSGFFRTTFLILNLQSSILNSYGLTTTYFRTLIMNASSCQDRTSLAHSVGEFHRNAWLQYRHAVPGIPGKPVWR